MNKRAHLNFLKELLKVIKSRKEIGKAASSFEEAAKNTHEEDRIGQHVSFLQKEGIIEHVRPIQCQSYLLFKVHILEEIIDVLEGCPKRIKAQQMRLKVLEVLKEREEKTKGSRVNHSWLCSVIVEAGGEAGEWKKEMFTLHSIGILTNWTIIWGNDVYSIDLGQVNREIADIKADIEEMEAIAKSVEGDQ